MKKKLLFLAVMAIFCYRAVAQVNIEVVSNFLQCNNEVFDLTMHEPVITENLPPGDYTVTYFVSLDDLISNTAITNPGNYIMPSGAIEQWIYAKVLNNANNGYMAIVFRIGFWESTPLFDYASGCESYVLAPLQEGIQYYTGPAGTGTMLYVGDVITESMTVYPFQTGIECTNSVGVPINVNHVPEIVPDPVVGCETMPAHGVFDFGPLIDTINAQYPNLYITLHESLQDAENGFGAISNIPGAYNNIHDYHTFVAFQVMYMRISLMGADCASVVEVPLEFVPCTGYLSGHVSFDADNNGCTESDSPAANMHVSYVSENITHHAYTDAEGNYYFFNVPNGNVDVHSSSFYPYNLVFSPTSHSLVFDGTGIDNVDFCISMPMSVNEVSVELHGTTVVQPGFPASYILKLRNYGSTTASGTVTIEFNDTALDFGTTSIPMVQNGNILTFNYSGLQPLQEQIIDLNFLVAMPGIIDLGDAVIFTANATCNEGQDYNMANNTYLLTQIVTNSWDPNDINVREGEQITEVQADDYLHYTIRFQNMGDANARNVKVLTTLDDNLNWDTFEPIVSSHDFQTNRTGNKVEFRFNNIQLPGAEVNEPESHGYVIYKIKPKATVIVGDSMSAEAGIYFDFNPVVNTNSITTTIMSTAGVADFNANGFVIYPNPTSSKVTLQMQNSTASNAGVTVTDVLGKTVIKTTVTGARSDLDVSSLKSGVYFITLTSDGNLATKKLVIK